LGPFDAWLTLRGIRTLAVRMTRHTQNALALARYLEGHAAVKRVCYPQLETSPFSDRARRLLPCGAGALLSFELAGGKLALDAMVAKLATVLLMPSLGHVATTRSHPPSTSHHGLTPAARAPAVPTDRLVRRS